jgi:hypothetical protein
MIWYGIRSSATRKPSFAELVNILTGAESV